MDSIQQQIYTNLAHEGLKPGHHTRDRTAGIDGAMQARFEEICNRWGVYEPGTEFRRALVQIPLWDDAPPPAPPSHFLVIFTNNKGRDSQGRLGAVLRHIVRIPAERHASLDYNPFRLLEQGQLLDEWSPGMALPEIDPHPAPTDAAELQMIFPERHGLLRVMLAQLLETGAMRLPVGADSMAVEEIFSQVFALVPLSRRPLLSLATFAFRNAEDYSLVAFHKRDARVRLALEALEEGEIPATGAVVDRYLTELFQALQDHDWPRAGSLIRDTALPDPTDRHPGSVRPGLPEAPGSAEDDGPPAGAAQPAKPARRRRADASEPEHHPHWQGSGAASEGARRGSRRWLPAVLLVVVLAAAGWYLATQRGGSAEPGGRTDTTMQLVTLRADGLAPLLDRHEQLLGQLLADDTRDLELREVMLAAAPTLASRVQQAVTADLRRLDRRLSGADGAEARPLATVGAELQTFVDEAAGDHRRALALATLLDDAEPAGLRAAYVDSSRRVFLDRLAPGTSPSLGEPLAQLTTVLSAAAEGLRAMGDEAGYAAQRWSDIAGQLEPATVAIPPAFGTPPRVVRAGHAAARSVAPLREAERRADLTAVAAAVPYASTVLRRGDVADAARSLAARSVDLAAAGAEIPAPLARIRRFYELAAESRTREPAKLSTAAASELLAELAGACAAPAALPCDDPVYDSHVERWQLEAWRALGGPRSAAGDAVLADLGDAGLPAGDRLAVSTMVDLLDRMVAAATPTAGPLADDVAAAARRHDQGLVHAICAGWLAGIQRRTADQRDTFRDLYDRWQEQLAGLREANDETGPAAFAALQGTAREIAALDLATVQKTGSLAAPVRSVRQLLGAVNGQHLVRIARIDLELLRNQDYAGTRHQEARPTIRISRVSGTSLNALYEYQAPPMPAAAGAGFEPATLQVRTAVPFRAADRLLLTAFEAGAGMWLHLYVEAPAVGHVAAELAGLHRVAVSAEVMRAVTAHPDQAPPASAGGDVVASVRVVLARGFWADLGGRFPDLP